MKPNKTFYILILSCILFISAGSNITASGKKENQGVEKKLFENHDVTFLGFSISVLKKPVRPKVVYETSDRDEPVEEFLWAVSYDYKTNVIKPFSPE